MDLKVIFALCACLSSANSEENADSDVVPKYDLFYTKLYKALYKVGNFVFSPVSVETLMYLAYDGSQGTTSDAIQDVVWPSRSQTPAERYNNLTRTIRSSNVATFLEPNKIYVSDLLNLSSSYIDTVERKYLTDVTSINFYNRQEVATAINNWVLNVTNNRIKNMLNKSDFSHYHHISVLMMSCVDFTGVWNSKFKVEDTKLQTFYLNEWDTKEVQMMHITNKKFDVLLTGEPNARILVLPFTDNNYVLTIFLPNERGKLEDMKKELFGLNIHIGAFVNDATRYTVNLALPRFKIESRLELKGPLSNMGLGEMFTRSANFSGMIDKPSRFNEVFVNNIFQESYFEINETGVEGAIGTVEKFSDKVEKRDTDDDPEIDFIVDHPFVFFLLAGNKENGYVDVFSGQVCNP